MKRGLIYRSIFLFIVFCIFSGLIIPALISSKSDINVALGIFLTILEITLSVEYIIYIARMISGEKQ